MDGRKPSEQPEQGIGSSGGADAAQSAGPVAVSVGGTPAPASLDLPSPQREASLNSMGSRAALLGAAEGSSSTRALDSSAGLEGGEPVSDMGAATGCTGSTHEQALGPSISGKMQPLSEKATQAAVEAALQIEREPGEQAPPPRFSWKAFALFIGPGLLMSVAYLDPGNLQADVSAGAETGFTLLWWFALVSLGCGFAFQCMSGRLGLVTGKDLAQHCGQRYPRAARWLLWLMLEVAIVCVDIQETVGCAQALYILSQGHIPLWAGCLIVSFTAFGLLLLERRGARWLECIFGFSIGILAISMAVNFFRAGVPADDFFKGLFIPKLSATSIIPAIGALGALVMPYNLFFHSAVVNSRPHNTTTEGHTRVLLKYLRLENMLALLLAFFINLCVVSVFAVGFYGNPDVDPDQIGLQAAGELLGVRFGQQFKYFWAVGLFASGQVATIALTYAGQLIMCGLLRLRVSGSWRYAATRLVALVPALTVALVSTSSNKFDELNQRLNIVQSLQLPFALLPAIHMTASKEVMGQTFHSSRLLTAFCSLISLTVVGVNGYFLVDVLKSQLPQTAASYALWPMLIALYYIVIGYYAIGPERAARWAAPLGRKAAAAGRAAVQRLKAANWRDPESMLEVHF